MTVTDRPAVPMIFLDHVDKEKTQHVSSCVPPTSAQNKWSDLPSAASSFKMPSSEAKLVRQQGQRARAASGGPSAAQGAECWHWRRRGSCR